MKLKVYVKKNRDTNYKSETFLIYKKFFFNFFFSVIKIFFFCVLVKIYTLSLSIFMCPLFLSLYECL